MATVVVGSDRSILAVVLDTLARTPLKAALAALVPAALARLGPSSFMSDKVN